MKILAIELEGFWGYREHARVDIAGVPLLVAVGRNGTGKSALVVSAVIAALYGKFPTRTVEESITTGVASGTVAVELTVSGSTYRVIRTHQRSGAASAAVYRHVDGDWEAVTEKGVREATAKVTELLGMDYKTAVMTWIAEQGKYGQFANADPAPRFKMLASIFDLDRYAPLHRAALERLRDAKERAAEAEGRVTELNDSIIGDDARDDDQMTDTALATAVAAANTAHDAAVAALTAHEQHDPQRNVTQARIALSAVKNVRLEQLRTAEQALADLRAARDNEPVRRDAAVAEAHARFEREVQAATTSSDTAIRDTQQRIADAQAQVQDAEATARTIPSLIAAVDEAVAGVRTATDTLAAAEAAVATADGNLRAADAYTAATRAALSDAEEVLTSLAHAGDCYACGQHITEALAAGLRGAQEQVIATRTTEVIEAASAREQAAAAVAAAKNTRAHTAAALDAAREQVHTAKRALERAEMTVSAADQSRLALNRDKARLSALGEELSATTIRLDADRAAAVAAAHTAHDTALAAIAERGQAAAAAVNTHRKPTADEETLEAALTAAEAVAASATEYAERTAVLSAERDTARAEAIRLAHEVGRRAEVARRQAEQGERIAEAMKALAAAQQEVTVHTDLAAAYSPSGIPSMVLESVIDNLNAAINTTLSELSGGDLQVRLATSRETSSGSQESKVTVYVETPTGTRSYEALSGGQRFRVDLAIRMGLAAIVASGTGTPIETFILDEGWGSLDEEGIRSTLEVLNRLSEQVNVLTVSHIDSVRDAFPARIEVSAIHGTAEAVVVR